MKRRATAGRCRRPRTALSTLMSDSLSPYMPPLLLRPAQKATTPIASCRGLHRSLARHEGGWCSVLLALRHLEELQQAVVACGVQAVEMSEHHRCRLWRFSARPGPTARGGRILGTRAVRGAGCSRAWRVGRAGRPSVRRSPRRLRAQPARPAAQRSPCEPRAPRQARERRSGLLRHRRTVSLVAVSAGGQRTVRGTARWRRRLAHSWGDAGGC